MIDFLARLEPQALLVGFTMLGALLAVPLVVVAAKRLISLRVAGGTLYLLAGALVLALGAGAALLAASLRTYSRLTHEHEAARVSMRQTGERHYTVSLRAKEAPPRHFELRGDEWQIDARILKWRALGTIIGFDTVYRLERLSGRYGEVDRERAGPRTVYALTREPGMDFWALVRRYHDYLPLADALYGSAAYVPMAEGAEYAVTVSSSGLVVRPANDSARKAVGGWR